MILSHHCRTCVVYVWQVQSFPYRYTLQGSSVFKMIYKENRRDHDERSMVFPVLGLLAEAGI